MRTSAQITEDIRGLAPSYQATYRRAQALRKLIDERSRPLLFELTAHRGSERLEDPGDAESYAYNLSAATSCQQVVGLIYMRDLLENSDIYKESAGLIQPLEIELEQALAAEAEQARVVQELENKVASALEEAERKALATVAKDSAVTKAREELKKTAGRLRTSAEIAADPPEPMILDNPVTAEAPGIERVTGPQESDHEELLADLK